MTIRPVSGNAAASKFSVILKVNGKYFPAAFFCPYLEVCGKYILFVLLSASVPAPLSSLQTINKKYPANLLPCSINKSKNSSDVTASGFFLVQHMLFPKINPFSCNKSIA